MRHVGEFGAFRVLRQHETTEFPDGLATAQPISIVSGKHDGDRGRPSGGRKRMQQQVDR